MAIDDQPSDHIHQEVHWTAMTGVFHLRTVLELVVDGFNQRPFAQQQLVHDLTRLTAPSWSNWRCQRGSNC
jgi:hypothetical protein